MLLNERVRNLTFDVRAGEIVEGQDVARARRPRSRERDLARGPARLCEALGITRDLLLQRAGEVGVQVREEPIPLADLPRVQELFLSGTTTEVMPVVKLDAHTIGDGTGVGTLRVRTCTSCRVPASFASTSSGTGWTRRSTAAWWRSGPTARSATRCQVPASPCRSPRASSCHPAGR